MSDEIAMIILLIVIAICFLIALFTYLVILGADMLENEEEKEIENQEQMEYLKNYKNRKKGKTNGTKNK